MAVRSKFQLQEVRQVYWSKTARVLVFRPVYDDSIPEDRRFAQATPTGEFTMTVDNPGALAQFTLGSFYYFDATPVPLEATA